jgi:putative oxygen-independent coproporphyrinogen III oxidase
VPSALPDGEPAPVDGALPGSALSTLGSRPFGLYVHVPFCATRCGYCDFNTYTATELGGGASQSSYADTAINEIRFARSVLAPADVVPHVDTVFFGGGTPTLLPAGDLARMLDAIREQFGLTDNAEITTEANPESVDQRSLNALRAAGLNRVSFGMQSAVPHVLATLDRQHTPGRGDDVVRWARSAGFEHISLDLIYGAPGESDDDWARSLASAIACEPDHVSAYALVIEDGTRMGTQLRRGEIAATDPDTQARRYEMAEATLSPAGFDWYEVSNWSKPGGECRHNLAYWRSDDWWGMGPGAHSHIGGVRWWNVRHPAAYAERVSLGRSPAQARELLTTGQRAEERVLLELRLREGLDPGVLVPDALSRLDTLTADGLIESRETTDEADPAASIRLTLRGRLLADLVVRALTD